MSVGFNQPPELSINKKPSIPLIKVDQMAILSEPMSTADTSKSSQKHSMLQTEYTV